MKKIVVYVMLLLLLGVPVQATEIVTEETYQAMLKEYYADEIAYFESQGEVIECVAFGTRLFVRYSPDVEDIGFQFTSNLYKWMNTNGYTGVEIYIGNENLWVIQV